MKLTAFLLLALLFFICANAQRPTTTNAPIWVTTSGIDFDKQDFNKEAEDGYVDLVFEKQVNLNDQSTYYKKVIKIISEAGIQNSSEISIDFDPSYQKIKIHTVNIRRGNTVFNKLDLDKLKTIQQEKELDRFQYNGTLTSILFLDDVRNGDIIEYSYTVIGFNPIFRDKYTDVLDMQFSVPVYNLYYKLVVPKSRNITIKNNRTSAVPVITDKITETQYEWKAVNLAPLHIEDNIPSWFDGYASIMLSEYKSWKEVSDWAVSLFPFDIPLSGQLQNKVNEFNSRYIKKEEKALAALHFVQDEIRYLGMEMGESSHRPSNPSKTFSQRYGDCKDKTYLLCILLRKMGIEANPALVNTTYKKTIADWLPSSSAFDHVTVRANIDNRIYWIDPTLSYQRGNIDDISYPDFQVCLVVAENTSGLTAIPYKRKGIFEVKEVFEVPDMSGTARLIVTTRFSGVYADNVREDFKSSSLHEMQKTYKDFYSDYFDEIKMDSLNYKDEVNGNFTTIEYYTIQKLWKEKNALKKAFFESYLINAVIKTPKDKKRNMPFALRFPAYYQESIEINLPDVWSIKNETEEINCTNFNFLYSYKNVGRKVILNYSYENIKDHVLPNETEDYVAALEKVNQAIGYELSSSTENKYATTLSGEGTNYSYLYALLGLCVVVTILIRNSRHKN